MLKIYDGSQTRAKCCKHNATSTLLLQMKTTSDEQIVIDTTFGNTLVEGQILTIN